MSGGLDLIREAIDIVEDSRQSHVLWADHLRRGGHGPAEVGDQAFHEDTIEGYDKVLDVLRVYEVLTEFSMRMGVSA